MEYHLFDLDGTLTDSQEGIINAISYALDYMGVHMERGGAGKVHRPAADGVPAGVLRIQSEAVGGRH